MMPDPMVRRRIFWTITTILTVLAAVYSTIFSLTHGIYDVFPFLYFLPIILFVYFYPSRGVIFSVCISTVYLLLVYYLSGFDPSLVAVSTAWFVIFITIGVVTSSFAEGLRTEEQKYRGIFENSQAGIFTFDLRTLRIIDSNEKCARMLNFERANLIGKNLTDIILKSDEQDTFFKNVREYRQTGDTELLFHTEEGMVRQFLISASLTPKDLVICSAIDITERKMAERVIQKARDDLEVRVKERTAELLKTNEELKAEIRERKRFETAIQLANRKLNTLSSITRHDILNQITALVMYLSLTEEMTTDPVVLANIKKIEQITQLIHTQIQFTRDYQDIGTGAPQWQDVTATIDNSIADLDLKDIRVEHELDYLEIYADLLLGKVFFNIVENSIRHGEHTRFIRFSYRETDDDLVIICEDDGIGVPAIAKEGIFRREYYHNTGYGLFLTEEILSITGISIRETGEPGKGVRFEISVPKGAFRHGLKARQNV
jgi:PAS domain S-box-containing protein